MKDLRAQDLFSILNYLSRFNSSADNIHTYSQSPIHVLVYKEMMSYSKNELENVIDEFGTQNIFKKTFKMNNPFLFSALLKKGAFENKLNNFSKWLLNEATNPSLDLYESVFNYERDIKNSNLSKENHIYTVFKYLEKIDTPEKINIAHKYHEKYFNTQPEKTIKTVFDKLKNNKKEDDYSKFLMNKFKEDNIDINQFNLLNKEISGGGYYQNNYSKMSINQPDKIEYLISKGFKLNENINGETFLTALLRSEKPELIKTFLPYVKTINPLDMTRLEQDKLVELYKDSPSYKELKILYSQTIYNNLIEEKKEKNLVLKVKI